MRIMLGVSPDFCYDGNTKSASHCSKGSLTLVKIIKVQQEGVYTLELQLWIPKTHSQRSMSTFNMFQGDCFATRLAVFEKN